MDPRPARVGRRLFGRRRLLLLAEVEVQTSIHAELVLDDFVYVAVETAVQCLDVQVEVVEQRRVESAHHQLSHHGGRWARAGRLRIRRRNALRTTHTHVTQDIAKQS